MGKEKSPYLLFYVKQVRDNVDNNEEENKEEDNQEKDKQEKG